MQPKIIDFVCEDWGLIDHHECYRRQLEAVAAVREGALNKLVVCSLTPTITIGAKGKLESFLYPQEEILKRGVEIIQVPDRNGDLTLHAPGQLVIIPIVDLNLLARDLRSYVLQLQAVAFNVIADFGIQALIVPERLGVFIGTKKIVSIGIGVDRWITYHGFSINVNIDPSLFPLIRPCGLDVELTSLSLELQKPVSMDEVKERLVRCFDAEFNDTSGFKTE